MSTEYREMNTKEWQEKKLKELVGQLNALVTDSDGIRYEFKQLEWGSSSLTAVDTTNESDDSYWRNVTIGARSSRWASIYPPDLRVMRHGGGRGSSAKFGITAEPAKIHSRVRTMMKRCREEAERRATRTAAVAEQAAEEAKVSQKLAPVLKQFGMKEGHTQFHDIDDRSVRQIRVDVDAGGATVTLEVSNLTPERVESLLNILTSI